MIINVLFWACSEEQGCTIAFLEKIGFFFILYNIIGLFSFFQHNVFYLHFFEREMSITKNGLFFPIMPFVS